MSSAKYSQLHQLEDEDEEDLELQESTTKLSISTEKDNRLEIEESRTPATLNNRTASFPELTKKEQLAVKNLDEFFSNVYVYFYEKGFWCIFTTRFFRLLTVLFIIAFSAFLSVFVNWKDLWHCKQLSCKDVQILKLPTSFTWLHGVTLAFESIFIVFWLHLCFRYLSECSAMFKIKSFYNSQLGISEADVQTINWQEIVDKIVALQQRVQISLVKPKLDEKDIVNFIMRKENYLIAFLNKKVLNLRIPFFGKTPVLTETLLWNLRYIISQMFNEDFEIKDEYLSNSTDLSWKFIWLGLLNVIAAPFIFVFLVVYLFFKYSVELREQGIGFLFDRRWTTFSKWRFREFNELPHIFELRMKKSIGHAKAYTQQFPSYIVSIVAKNVMFFASGFAAVLILMTAIKSDLLLYVSFFQQNMVWWLSILVVVYLNAKSLIIHETQVFDPNNELKLTAEHTHYMPKKWRERGHHLTVREGFLSLFQYTIVVLIEELASIVLTPIVLCFVMPRSSEKFVQFVEKITERMDGAGDVCGFATFNVSKYGNAKYGASSDIVVPKALRSKQGKMEKSLLSFVAHNPKWRGDGENQKLIKTLSDSLSMSIGPQAKASPPAQQSTVQSLPTLILTPVPEEQKSPVSAASSSSSQFPPFSAAPEKPMTVTAEMPRKLSPMETSMTASVRMFHMLDSYYESRIGNPQQSVLSKFT